LGAKRRGERWRRAGDLGNDLWRGAGTKELMKKIMMMVAMLALILVMAVPAFAADAVSGDVEFVDCGASG
jgi:hypothetical protein